MKKKTFSASATKLNYFGITLDDRIKEPETDDDCYGIIQKSALQSVFDFLACPFCDVKPVMFDLQPDKSNGCSPKCKVHCSSCATILYEDYLCNRLGNATSTRTPFEINILATLAFRGIGCGFSAMNDWCSSMNIAHCLNPSAYPKNVVRLHSASRKTFDEVATKSVETIFKV